MGDDSQRVCRVCGKPVGSIRDDFGDPPDIHRLCYHMAFEHDTDPDYPCRKITCPLLHTSVYKEKLLSLGLDTDRVFDEILQARIKRGEVGPPQPYYPPPKYQLTPVKWEINLATNLQFTARAMSLREIFCEAKAGRLNNMLHFRGAPENWTLDAEILVQDIQTADDTAERLSWFLKPPPAYDYSVYSSDIVFVVEDIDKRTGVEDDNLRLQALRYYFRHRRPPPDEWRPEAIAPK